MKFLAFAASHRPESYNRMLVKLAQKHMTAKAHEVDFAEYGEFDMPVYNDSIEMPESCKIFGKRAANADGIIIALPEYNWSYPGSLKNIIDWTSCMTPNPIAGKTALLFSATPGARGGIMGLSHLKSPLESMQMHVFHRVFPLSHSESALSEKGELTDAKQSQLLKNILDDYITYTQKFSDTK